MSDPTAQPIPAEEAAPGADAAPACVMSFNATDPSGAGGLSGDVATLCAMGAHPLPVTTCVLIRDTAETFEHLTLDEDQVVEQARVVLEDLTVQAWKVGFLGSAEVVSAIAEILSDYPDTPLVAYMPSLPWMEEAELDAYLDAYRELILPQTEVLVGSLSTLTQWLMPEWHESRTPSPKELAKAAAAHGAGHVLVTGIQRADGYVENTLASAQSVLVSERFERFDATFLGAGDTLSAALAAMLANGGALAEAVQEALTFLDQALDAGFRPGMGNVLPDRFFWAQPPADEAPQEADGAMRH